MSVDSTLDAQPKLLNHLWDEIRPSSLKEKVGIVEYLLELIHNTGTWWFIVISMSVIRNDFHVKHKVVLSFAVFTEATNIFIVVIISYSSCVI